MLGNNTMYTSHIVSYPSIMHCCYYSPSSIMHLYNTYYYPKVLVSVMSGHKTAPLSEI